MAGSDLFSRKIFVIILALLCSARAMSMIDNHSLEEKQIEEYYLDHEVSEMEAFAAARSADINESPVGCKTCTVDQLMYCFGNGLLNDHCCCDKRYEETLPFIPLLAIYRPKHALCMRLIAANIIGSKGAAAILL
ncbi:uncharacterized protein LOC113381846 [Ctenocephalides felis]|uniref:uncharacterized protein LOC113381846 n=1 Tax=Ctenocephalides felis TaxID=7515 RepID=UPI000E6E22B7|nr:uncharacterized protein LOC113381846 [Ctenocephalides felis]